MREPLSTSVGSHFVPFPILRANVTIEVLSVSFAVLRFNSFLPKSVLSTYCVQGRLLEAGDIMSHSL